MTRDSKVVWFLSGAATVLAFIAGALAGEWTAKDKPNPEARLQCSLDIMRGIVAAKNMCPTPVPGIEEDRALQYELERLNAAIQGDKTCKWVFGAPDDKDTVGAVYKCERP